MKRQRAVFSLSEWLRLATFFGIITLLHVIGFGLFFYYLKTNKILTGAGFLAYSLGLRHAFDADHIAAIDNTTRCLLQKNKRPLGVGFFFSLGHSSVVVALTVALAFAAIEVHSHIPMLQQYGSYIGTSISGVFLWLVGILNLLVLVNMVRVFRSMKTGTYDDQQLEQHLSKRGFLNRLFHNKINRFVSSSWKMFPIGFLFGLGFDTATEVAILAIAVSASTKHVPALAIISLPIIFAAGMSLMDTVDAVFMSRAYHWAFANPVRKIYYNLVITSLSVFVALAVGSIELLQVVSEKLGLSRGPWHSLNQLNFGVIGLGIVFMFIMTWLITILVWRKRTTPELAELGYG